MVEEISELKRDKMIHFETEINKLWIQIGRLSRRVNEIDRLLRLQIRVNEALAE